jgi:hypothetical protein
MRSAETTLLLHFFLARSVRIAGDDAQLELSVLCPSRDPQAPRTMLVYEQLESIAAHDAYHLNRIVLLRQLFGAWPPPSGGDTW